MRKETIDRYAEKIANICVEQEMDCQKLTSLQFQEIINQVVRQDVYASCPTFDPHALEALIAFSNSFSDCLNDFLSIDPTLPFVGQCESLEPAQKHLSDLVNDFAHRSLLMALRKLGGNPYPLS